MLGVVPFNAAMPTPRDTIFNQAFQTSEADFKTLLKAGLHPFTQIETEIPGQPHGSVSDSFKVTLARSNSQGPCLFFVYQIRPGQHMVLSTAEVNQRGSNAAATVMGNFYKAARLGQCTGIRVGAQEVGAYVWSRAGFKPDRNDWVQSVRRHIGKKLDRLNLQYPGAIPPALQQNMREILKQDDPSGHWQITDQRLPLPDGSKLGSALTVNIPWSGLCDFNDPACVARLERYTRVRHAPPTSIP